MAEKRFYWIRLKDSFFRRPQVKRLLSIDEHGRGQMIYLRMLLLAVDKPDRTIMFQGIDNTIANEIAFDIDAVEIGASVEMVQATIEKCLRVKLIQSDDPEQYLYFSDLESMTGSESSATQRTRKFREKHQKSAKGTPKRSKETPERFNETLKRSDETDGNKMKRDGNAAKQNETLERSKRTIYRYRDKKDIEIDTDTEKSKADRQADKDINNNANSVVIYTTSKDDGDRGRPNRQSKKKNETDNTADKTDPASGGRLSKDETEKQNRQPPGISAKGEKSGAPLFRKPSIDEVFAYQQVRFPRSTITANSFIKNYDPERDGRDWRRAFDQMEWNEEQRKQIAEAE